MLVIFQLDYLFHGKGKYKGENNMKLKECLELGKACGLTTWEECYDNVDLHAMSIFKYDEINKEILELQQDMFYHDPDKFCQIFKADK